MNTTTHHKPEKHFASSAREFIAKFFGTFANTEQKSDPILLPAEELYARDLAELDASNPSWDQDLVIQNAALQLRLGMTESDVAVVFGQDVLDSAKRRSHSRS